VKDELDPYTKALTLAKKGENEAAGAVLKDILRANSEDERAWYLLSFAVQSRREKINLLRQALRVDPEYTKAETRLDMLEAVDFRTPPPQKGERSVQPISVGKTRKNYWSAFSRIGKYSLIRGFTLMVAVVIAVYLTLLLAEKGGGPIESELRGNLLKGWFSGIGGPTRVSPADQALSSFVEQLDLVLSGLTLNLTSTRMRYFSSGTLLGDVREIIQDHLARTLLLFGTANILLFFTTIAIALFLLNRRGSWMDKLMISLSPLSSAPAWVYGLILTVFSVQVLHISTGGMLDTWPSEFKWQYVPIIAKKFVLPILAIFLSRFFQGVYAWRTFLLIYANEDYVEYAKAKGLSSRAITRRYILRPTLPSIITRFTMMIIGIWQEAIVIELFFAVSGIGHLFYQALKYRDINLVMGLAVTFAYLMVISVFFLDILYALIDPRVRLGDQGITGEAVTKQKWWFRIRSKVKRFRHRKQRPLLPVRSRQMSPERESRTWSERFKSFWERTKTLKPASIQIHRDLVRSPGVVVGVLIILGLIGISVYTVIAIPYDEAISLWRGEGNVWYRNPETALPEWANYFRSSKLPSTIILDSQAGGVREEVEVIGEGMREMSLSFSFDYPYDGFPQDVVLFLDPQYDEKKPHISIDWITPDGREINFGSLVLSGEKYAVSDDGKLQRKLRGDPPQRALFTDPDAEEPTAVQGQYELRLNGILFEEEADLNAEMIVYGQVYGLAGTDHQRRDLKIAMLWGMPVALSFGFLAAVFTSILTMIFASIGSWYKGWVDGLIQRITEVTMVLPAFPVLLLIYNFYSKRIWALLGVIILLNIFGPAIKTYRSIFLQVRESPYVESAQAYGSSNFRIIFVYLIPRIISVLIPQLVLLIPSYVFLEATLAYLLMSDPYLPTWGKVIREAISHGGLTGNYYWLLEPFGLLALTAFAFLLLGFALENTIDPRLKER